MTPEEIKKAEQHIDGMTQMEMAQLWRFAPVGHPYFDYSLPLHERFDKRFTELGRFTPAVSKAIGWER